MSEWLTYDIDDFLLFSPRVYWRMFELHNQTVWPLQIPALLLGTVILTWILRPRRWSDRAVSAILGAAWLWVAWSFFWDRYSTINWAAVYVVPVFVAQGLFLLVGTLVGRPRWSAGPNLRGAAGLVLFLYALALHPVLAVLDGRPMQAEVFGIAPDPLAIATLGLLMIRASGGMAGILVVVPAAWCLVSATTLAALGAAEAWVPAAAVALTAVSWLGSWIAARRLHTR